MGFYLEPGFMGGVLLILGAFALYQGKLMWSVGLYFIADIMWVILAFKNGDTIGSIFILIGMTLGLLVFLKARSGEFVKDLKVDLH